MSASSELLSTIQACSGIVLAQIPAACARIASETRYALASLQSGSGGLTVSMEAKIIYSGVLSYYTNIVSSANGHENSLSGNEYASNSARQWRRNAGALLEALVDGLGKLPDVESLYIEACKYLNHHIMNNAASYDGSRVKRTDQLTEIIQRVEPDYRKPAALYPGFGMAVFSTIAALLLFIIPFLMTMGRRYYMGFTGFPTLPVIESAALLMCAIFMKKEKAMPAKIFATIPLLCHLSILLRSMRYILHSPAAVCARLCYVPYYRGREYGFINDGCLILAGLSMLALMTFLALYIWGILKVDFKNVWASLCFALMLIGAGFGSIFFAVTTTLRNGIGPNFYLNLLASVLLVTAAACIMWRFQNFPLKKPAPRKKAEF